MVLLNQRVADEITSLVARHRYGIEDGRDAVRSAEQAAAERNAQLRAEAAERRAGLPELGARAHEQRDRQYVERPAATPRRPVFEDDEDFSAGSWLR
ncbi:hypothetical protein [Saccharopolyspora sp. SCSIO 74807]|uniref:hypothetical protein n=1 Tax=Saccharopolyspora sp. SCSIO 74807 TaxID=3118084 RepID=UPI0030CBF303